MLLPVPTFFPTWRPPTWANLWLGLLFAVASGQAEESTAPRIAPSKPTVATSTNRFSFTDYIDRKHAVLCGYVIDFGHSMDAALAESFRHPEPQPRNGRVDKFVSDQRLEDDNPESRIKVTPSLKLRDSDGMEFNLRVNGKLRLPRFEDRVDLILSSTDEGDSILDDLDRKQNLQSGNQGEGTASLRYHLKETLHFKSSLDAGLRFRPEPDPRLSLRLRVYHGFEYVTTRFTQTFFWEAHDGFGEKSQFDIEQQKARHYLRRLSTTVLWSEDSDGVEAGESFSYYKYLSGRRVIGTRLGISGVLEPSARVENYTARLVYRKRVHRNWMFLELEPGVDFPRDRDFQTTGFFNIKLDIIFGDWGDLPD